MNDINRLQEMINECNNIVFFGGAGVSTASGLKDFRSKDGLYSEEYKYPPEYMLSSRCFYYQTEDFFEFYKAKMNSLKYKPNIIHDYLTKLEKTGKLKGIVTQNIDGLHQASGSRNVFELHGTIHSNHCLKCNKFYDATHVFNSKGIPTCECGGTIKPDVVLYGEPLPSDAWEKSEIAISKADMLIVAGTSLTVYPASNMVDYFHGKYLVIINNDETDYDNRANLVIHEDLKKVFSILI